jgi:hypothetical protein
VVAGGLHALVLVLSVPSGAQQVACATPNTNKTRYVNCTSGDNNKDGMSAANAWKTMRHAAGMITSGTMVRVSGGPCRESQVTIRGKSDIHFRPDHATAQISYSPSQYSDAFLIEAVPTTARILIERFDVVRGTAPNNDNDREVFNEAVQLRNPINGPAGAVSDITIQKVKVLDATAGSAFTVRVGGSRVCFIDTEAKGAGQGADNDGDGMDDNVEDASGYIITTTNTLTDLQFWRAVASGNSGDGFEIKTPTGVVNALFVEANATNNMGDGTAVRFVIC